MKNLWINFLAILVLVVTMVNSPISALPAAAASPPDLVQSELDAPFAKLLDKYRRLGDDGLARFDYAGLSTSDEDRRALGAYIDSMAGQLPSKMPADQAVSYWANLYNAITVKLIVDNYPVKSIRDIKSGLFSIGPWGKDVVTVEGETLTLNNIEHDIMRKKYPSPLIHYMVNCASVGCPNLPAAPWHAASLDKDRAAAARAFINSPRGVQITNEQITVSTIYKWYKKDFGPNQKVLLSHLIDYAEPALKTKLAEFSRIDRYEYDWSLNESPAK